MSTVAQFSLAQYEHMAELGAFDGKFQRRVELIHGEIRDMSPIGTEHAYVVDLVTQWSHLCVQLDRALVRTQNPVRIPALESEPEPDVVWVRNKSYASQHPEPADVLLLIEVADSSLAFDRGEKLAIYAASGIPEYWIVNLVDRQIEIFRDPVRNQYASASVARGEAPISPLAAPDASLRPTALLKR